MKLTKQLSYGSITIEIPGSEIDLDREQSIQLATEIEEALAEYLYSLKKAKAKMRPGYGESHRDFYRWGGWPGWWRLVPCFVCDGERELEGEPCPYCMAELSP